MKIWSDVSKSLGLDQNVFSQRNFAVYGNNMVVIEGQKRLVSVKNDEVCFAYGEGFLTVLGQNLVIKSMSKGFAVVQGEVTQVDF